LGSTLFYLVTGKVRLPGDNTVDKICNLTIHKRKLDSRKFGVSEPVAKLIDRLANYDAEQRTPTMQAAIKEIEQTLSELGKTHKESTIRVLIVEDNEDDMFITLRLLREMNRSLETLEATCWADACRVLSQPPPGNRFDICLLDLNLPDSGGMETILRFREIAPHIPLVVMTGIDDVEFGKQCIRQGADEYLPKDQIDHKILERSVFITLSRIRVARGESLKKSPPPLRKSALSSTPQI
jgi:CheY-like chemotaxis protein